MKCSFSRDDLPVVNGRTYHLDLAPEELARDVIVVGDPDRVPLLADEFLVEREVDRLHRGFRTITGGISSTPPGSLWGRSAAVEMEGDNRGRIIAPSKPAPA